MIIRKKIRVLKWNIFVWSWKEVECCRVYFIICMYMNERFFPFMPNRSSFFFQIVLIRNWFCDQFCIFKSTYTHKIKQQRKPYILFSLSLWFFMYSQILKIIYCCLISNRMVLYTLHRICYDVLKAP
jgi:hypothetical protein